VEILRWRAPSTEADAEVQHSTRAS